MYVCMHAHIREMNVRTQVSNQRAQVITQRNVRMLCVSAV